MKNKEFVEFIKWFKYWQKRLGLMSWRILNFRCAQKRKDTDPYCTISYIVKQHEAWVYFYGGDTKEDVKEKALHEVLHLLLAPLTCNDEKAHSVINTILNGFYLLEADNGGKN